MRGFVETKKTLFLDKEAHNILNDFGILIKYVRIREGYQLVINE